MYYRLIVCTAGAEYTYPTVCKSLTNVQHYRHTNAFYFLQFKYLHKHHIKPYFNEFLISQKPETPLHGRRRGKARKDEIHFTILTILSIKVT